MALTDNYPFAGLLATRLKSSRDALTSRWLERIAARVSMEPNQIFPTHELLNHVPVLIEGVAAYVADSASVISSDMAVMDEARKLGALRHEQGFDQYQILKEFEILGGILLNFVGEVAEESDLECGHVELLASAQRVFHAVCLIQEATSTQFLRLATDRVAEREERLRAFNRALTHEFRNRIGASLGAGQILQLSGISDEKREELASLIVRNAHGMKVILENLLELTLVGADARRHRHVRLPQAAAEVARELRELARANGVDLRLADDLPNVEVAAAAVELCLTNLVSNSIKYSDQSVADRWIEVRAAVESTQDDATEIVVRVADNGMGVPEHERARLFERFFRATHNEIAAGREIDGTGLGLSIIRETVKSLGGRAWAEFPDKGSTFAFSLPCRRAGEASGEEPAE